MTSLPDAMEEEEAEMENVEKNTLTDEVPSVVSLSMDPPQSNSATSCHPTAWCGKSQGLEQLVKKAVANASTSMRVGMEISIEPQHGMLKLSTSSPMAKVLVLLKEGGLV